MKLLKGLSPYNSSKQNCTDRNKKSTCTSLIIINKFNTKIYYKFKSTPYIQDKKDQFFKYKKCNDT